LNRGAVIGRYHFGSLKWFGITIWGAVKRLVMFVLTGLFVAPAALVAQAAPCLIVTITGSRGGAGLCNGLAGPGTLVRYGDESDKCNAVRLQFDAGRGTRLRLSQVGVQPEQLTAIFFTHMHSDHVEGFIDVMQLRWHNVGAKLDVVRRPMPSRPWAIP